MTSKPEEVGTGRENEGEHNLKETRPIVAMSFCKSFTPSLFPLTVNSRDFDRFGDLQTNYGAKRRRNCMYISSGKVEGLEGKNGLANN